MIIAFVKWIDAVSGDAWYDSEDLNDTGAICFSSGFLHSKNEHGIMLYLNHDTMNDKKSCTMFIPTGMILEYSLIEMKNDSNTKFIPKLSTPFKIISLLSSKK